MSSYTGPRHGATDRDPQSLYDPDLPTADLPRERSFSKVAGVAALASVVLTFSARIVALRGSPDVGDDLSDDEKTLTTIGDSTAGQEVATYMLVVADLLVVVVAFFLYRAIKARRPGHSPLIPLLALVSLVLISISATYLFFDLRDLGREFVSSASRNGTSASRLLDDNDDEALTRVANIVSVLATVGFGLWISLASFEATNVGLLTRFLGVFGTGAGLTNAIPVFGQIGNALFVAWLASVGVLCLGYWPGGRPPAWETGQATLPWEQQGERPAPGRRHQPEGET